MKFAVGIPTINRADLLKEALDTYTQTIPDVQIFICDNGNQDEIQDSGHIKVFKQPNNLGVAGSWNMLCETIFEKHDCALILNDDVIFGHGSRQVVAWMQMFNFDVAASLHNFCSYLIKKSVFLEVGKFDERFFPAYFEDNDYMYRLKLLNKQLVRTNFLDPSVYRNSMTIKKDASLNSCFKDNAQYYFDKWGGTPTQEKFITPFNQ